MGLTGWVISYFFLGIVSLSVFDLLTRRLRDGLKDATAETQSKLLGNGTLVTPRRATVMLLGAVVLFWPMVFTGVLIDYAKHWRTN